MSGWFLFSFSHSLFLFFLPLSFSLHQPLYFSLSFLPSSPLFSYAEWLLWVSGYLSYAYPLSRSLVLSLPHAAEVRTRTLQQSDNIPPSDNAINEAEFTYNTQHAALRFSARWGVRCAKRALLCQCRLWRGSPAGQPLEPSQTNDTRNASTTPTSPACLTLLMLTMPVNTTTSTLSIPLRVKMPLKCPDERAWLCMLLPAD